jgi:hypothetical protein
LSWFWFSYLPVRIVSLSQFKPDVSLIRFLPEQARRKRRFFLWRGVGCYSRPKLRHHVLYVRKCEQIDGKAEKILFPAIVEASEQLLQYADLLLQFGLISGQSDFFDLLKIRELPLLCDERILDFLAVVILFARVFIAQVTVFNPAVTFGAGVHAAVRDKFMCPGSDAAAAGAF